jgi:hypothetical protein
MKWPDVRSWAFWRGVLIGMAIATLVKIAVYYS